MPISVGAGSSGALLGGAAGGSGSKNELRDTINRLERQRDDYKRRSAARPDGSADKKIKALEDRIDNLRSRMDRMETQADGGCETCKNRKYQDGSDDPGVSFKSASKISGSAEAAVRGHEQEHVTRNRAKAEREDKEIVYQSVIIKHAICPECGTNYVSGGETTTVTRTKPESGSADKDGLSVGGKAFEDGVVYGKDREDGADENADAAGSRGTKRDERFNVGMYDREREIGKFLNVVA